LRKRALRWIGDNPDSDHGKTVSRCGARDDMRFHVDRDRSGLSVQGPLGVGMRDRRVNADHRAMHGIGQCVENLP